jgi:hypothetical protein
MNPIARNNGKPKILSKVVKDISMYSELQRSIKEAPRKIVVRAWFIHL